MRLPDKLLAPLSLLDLEDLSIESAQRIRECINVRLTDKLYLLNTLSSFNPLSLLLSPSPPVYSLIAVEKETFSGG
jgi:hypothetical protein